MSIPKNQSIPETVEAMQKEEGRDRGRETKRKESYSKLDVRSDLVTKP